MTLVIDDLSYAILRASPLSMIMFTSHEKYKELFGVRNDVKSQNIYENLISGCRNFVAGAAAGKTFTENWDRKRHLLDLFWHFLGFFFVCFTR